jgi:glycerophosphoryl diester phosphodiesterase
VSWSGEIVGHRGAAGLAPENTLVAFEAAIEAGCDRVEFDLRTTADAELVVFHDARLGRFVEGGDLQRPVFRRHSGELRALDVGALSGRPGCRVPLLSELLDALNGRVALNPEVKGSGAEGLFAMRRTVAILRERELFESCVISSFHASVVGEARRLAEDLPRALLVGREASRDPVAQAMDLGCAALHAHRSLVDESLVERCRDHELTVRAFTVNEEADMLSLVKLGVDGIVTDRPDRLRELVGR